MVMKKKYIAPEIRITVMDASSGFAAGSGSNGTEVTTSDGSLIPDKNGKEDPASGRSKKNDLWSNWD
jgi:hypothetical protein